MKLITKIQLEQCPQPSATDWDNDRTQTQTSIKNVKEDSSELMFVVRISVMYICFQSMAPLKATLEWVQAFKSSLIKGHGGILHPWQKGWRIANEMGHTL